jgi:V8-like Glu-specific endopeptidase
MRHRLPAGLLAGLLLLGLVAPAAARGPSPSHHDQVVAHWTAARLASAAPRDFVFDAARGFVPRAKPGGGGGSGSSWNGGGLVLQASGKVYFEMGGGAYVCSGSVATDTRSGYSLVLTAAHCAYDETNEAFATNWLFIPNFDGAPTFTCAQTVHGCWSAQGLVVHEGYATAGGFNTQATIHDFAFAIVGPGGKSGSAQLDTTVGSFDITFSSFSAGTQMYAFGYPAAGRYKGKDLTYCAGLIFFDPYNSNLTYGMDCNMTGGSSGGPWLSSFSTGTGVGVLSSLNSYGYSGVRAMHGPKFNADTGDVWSTANSATSNTIVH